MLLEIASKRQRGPSKGFPCSPSTAETNLSPRLLPDFLPEDQDGEIVVDQGGVVVGVLDDP